MDFGDEDWVWKSVDDECWWRSLLVWGGGLMVDGAVREKEKAEKSELRAGREEAWWRLWWCSGKGDGWRKAERKASGVVVQSRDREV